MSPRTTTLASVVATAALALPATAAAHVTIQPTELPAEGYARVELAVPHGCEASPTTSLTVRMPDEVVSATPQEVAGWRITKKEGRLARPVDSHGQTITTGVREVTWTGGPLPADHLQVFGLSVRIVGEPGARPAFKAIQRCRKGETAWIEIADPGGPEPEAPAPTIALTAGDGHGATDDATDGDDASAVRADAGDDGSGLAIVAVVLAALALLASGASLVRGRRA
ncbi:MAG: YcnI family protein [Solirubrobacteraceae bacterium]|nr:YcnI family protein [Solirubrobacteraceae bacterium]